jgi:hypothetical protein
MKKRAAEPERPLPAVPGGDRGGLSFANRDIEQAQDFLLRVIAAACEGRNVRGLLGAVASARTVLEHARWGAERAEQSQLGRLIRQKGSLYEVRRWLVERLAEVDRRIEEERGVEPGLLAQGSAEE